MKIRFDGTEFMIEDTSKNIVEIAKDNGIYITAPCFYNKRENGCCNSCLILVNGEIARACETLPSDDMEIIYDRDDLIEQRTNNLERFSLRRNIETGVKGCGCGSGHSHEDGGSCCGGSCDSSGGCGDNCSCGSH